MKFLELHLKGFGKFHDRTISFTDVAEHRKMTFTANMNPGKMEEPTRVLSA